MVEEQPSTSEALSTMATKETDNTSIMIGRIECPIRPLLVNGIVECNTQGGTESTCNNDNAESSPLQVNGSEKLLELADELLEEGTLAGQRGKHTEAADCFSRALKMRVRHCGEFAPDSAILFYKYGHALFFKAQEGADPLGMVPKEAESQQDSDKDGSVKTAINSESSTASVSSNAQQEEGSNQQEGAADDDVANPESHLEELKNKVKETKSNFISVRSETMKKHKQKIVKMGLKEEMIKSQEVQLKHLKGEWTELKKKMETKQLQEGEGPQLQELDTK